MNLLYRIPLLAALLAFAACDGGPGLDPASDASLGGSDARPAPPESDADRRWPTFCSDGEVDFTFPVNLRVSAPGHDEPLRVVGGLETELEIEHLDGGLVRVDAKVEAEDLVVTNANGTLTYEVEGEEEIDLTIPQDGVVTETVSFEIDNEGDGEDYRLDIRVAGRQSDCGDGVFGVSLAVTGVRLIEE